MSPQNRKKAQPRTRMSSSTSEFDVFLLNPTPQDDRESVHDHVIAMNKSLLLSHRTAESRIAELQNQVQELQSENEDYERKSSTRLKLLTNLSEVLKLDKKIESRTQSVHALNRKLRLSQFFGVWIGLMLFSWTMLCATDSFTAAVVANCLLSVHVLFVRHKFLLAHIALAQLESQTTPLKLERHKITDTQDFLYEYIQEM